MKGCDVSINRLIILYIFVDPEISIGLELGWNWMGVWLELGWNWIGFG